MESGEAVLTAAIVTVLISVPTVSQNIDYSGTADTESPVFSTRIDKDFQVDIDQDDESTVTIEKQDLVYKVSETPEKRVEELETPEATLKTKLTNYTTVSILSSPYGEYRKGMIDGRKFTEFKGANKTRLKSKMSEMKEKISNYRSIARQEMLPDVEIRITRSKTAEEDERVSIDNDETESLDLTGWTLKNSDGDSYEFNDLEIDARGTAMVYTTSRDEINVSENSSNQYLYGTGTDWDSDSEQATLFNAEGVEVAEDSY